MNRAFLSLQLLLVCTIFQLAAQTSQVSYIGIEKGLSNNSVTSIFQDHYGLMWFGTYDGLNRYNGYEFKVFRNQVNDSASLIHNRIVCITEDAKHQVWVGTKMGLSIYNPANSKFSSLNYRSPGKKKAEKIDFTINDLEADQHGNVYIATAGKGLLYYAKGSDVALTIPVKAQASETGNTHIQSIKIDAQQRIWVFIQGWGIYQLDQKSHNLVLVNNEVKLANAMEADANGHIWLGADNGLYAYDSQKNSCSAVEQVNKGLTGGSKIVGLNLDRSKQLWIATDGSGAVTLAVNSGKAHFLRCGTEGGQLKSAAIYAIYQDRNARTWIGTLRGGINVIAEQQAKFKNVAHNPQNSNSLINNFVLSFCEGPGGNLWIGTDGGGLSYWDKSSNTYRNYTHRPNNPQSLVNNNVTGILKDSRNKIWISTYGGGICRYVPESDSFQRYDCYNSIYHYYNNNVWLLYETKKQELFAGTVDGALYRLNPKTDQFEVYDNSLMNVISFKEDSSGQLWAGTFAGLIKVDPKHQHNAFYKTDYPVRTIHEDLRGALWLGTEGGGLQLFNKKTNSFRAYTELNGLSSNSVLNIIEDKRGMFWLSTFNGLVRFDPKSKKVKNYYAADGLQSNQFNYNAALYTEKGELLFGGINGYSIFHPDSLRAVGKMPKLWLNGLRINNKPLNLDAELSNTPVYDLKEIELPYDKNMLSVDFMALDYGAEDKIYYAYYLEGWDKEWNYVNKVRTANYSRLDEGEYLLKIKSTNAEGEWNTGIRTLKIKILPPWYRTWWAYGLDVLIISTVLYGFLHYKSRQAELLLELKMANFKVEKEKEMHERKLAFFTNVSHEFRSPLTLIINPVKDMIDNKAAQHDGTQLNVVYRNARRLLSLVDQLLLFTRAESTEEKLHISAIPLVPLCREVYLCFVQQAKSKGLSYELTTDDEVLMTDVEELMNDDEETMVYGDREKIEIMLFNLISNAMKFAPVAGFVKVMVRATQHHIIVEVANNGPQISAEIGASLFNKYYQESKNKSAVKAGFGIGLFLVKSFAQLHQALADYSSTAEETKFSIHFKRGMAHLGQYQLTEIAADSPTAIATDSSPILKELLADTEPDLLLPFHQPLAETALLTEQPSILLIDDNQQIRSYLKGVLQSTYRLQEADSAEQGLEKLKKEQPDLIICDVVMPGSTGVELCSILKKDKSLSHIPFILLTGTDSAAIKMKGFEEGADDYLTKPFENEMLLTRVKALLKRQQDLQQYFFNRITLKTDQLKISADHKLFLDRCIAIVEARLTDHEFNISVLAAELGMSHSSLYKHVKLISGQSISSFIRFIRLRKAAELFIRTEHNVTEVAFEIGFSDLKYFREQFSKLFGCKPSDYIRQYRKTFNQTYHLQERPF